MEIRDKETSAHPTTENMSQAGPRPCWDSRRRKAGQGAQNLVSTFCYLSLKRESRDLVHSGRAQALLWGTAQAAEYHSCHRQDEEEEDHPIAEDACVHAASLVSFCQLLLSCKDTNFGASSSLFKLSSRPCRNHRPQWGREGPGILGEEGGLMAPHSPCSIIKTHLRASRGHAQERNPGEKPSRARSTTPLPRHPGNARASDKNYGGPC